MGQENRLGIFVRTRVEQLCSKFGRAESHYMVRVLMEEYFGIDRVKIVLEPDLILTVEQMDKVDKSIAMLMDNVPLQYVIGEMEFFELRFKVAPGVLIPRPETEEMVGLICRQFVRDAGLSILDIGTGSGCIAVSLASWFPNATVTAIDISDEALKTAKANAKSNNVNINLLKCDILSESLPTGKFNLIVSNPPYVCEREKASMQPNVIDHEPHEALFVPDDDPLLFYRHIAAHAFGALNHGGQLWFEINEAYSTETQQCCRQSGFDEVEIISDFREKPRFCKGTKR